MAAPTLELRVFGAPVVAIGGQEVRMPLKRAVALLVYLAVNGVPVPRLHLASMLWPDAPEAQARTRLRRLIYTVEEIAGNLLVTRDDCLSLLPEVSIDICGFAHFARRCVELAGLDDAMLTEARRWIGLRRHRMFQGLSFGSSPFDDWLHTLTIEHEHLAARLMERTVDALSDRRQFDAAVGMAEELIAVDVYREGSYLLLMRLHALQGQAAGVEAAYARCAEVVRAEFGIRPGPQIEEAYARMTADLRRLSSHRIERPRVRFAESELGAVAYTTLGEGPQTLVIAPGFVSHIEIGLELAAFQHCIKVLSERFRVILFDRRGVGLSERLGATTTPAATAADIRAILDDAGTDGAWIFGSSEGGLGAMRFAIDHPERVVGLCLFGSLARGSAAPDYPWVLTAQAYDAWLQRMVAAWGGPVGLETFAPSGKDDPILRAWWARMVRHAASPGTLKAILAGLRDADIRTDLARIAAPTLVMHRRGDRAVRFEAGEHLARTIPGAALLPLEGEDHFWWCGDSAAVLAAMVQFTEESRREGTCTA